MAFNGKTKKKKTPRELLVEYPAKATATKNDIRKDPGKGASKSANPESTIEKKAAASGPSSVDPSKLHTRGVDTKPKAAKKRILPSSGKGDEAHSKAALEQTRSRIEREGAKPTKASPPTRANMAGKKPSSGPSRGPTDAPNSQPRAAKTPKHSPPTRADMTGGYPEQRKVSPMEVKVSGKKPDTTWAQAKLRGQGDDWNYRTRSLNKHGRR